MTNPTGNTKDLQTLGRKSSQMKCFKHSRYGYVTAQFLNRHDMVCVSDPIYMEVVSEDE